MEGIGWQEQAMHKSRQKVAKNLKNGGGGLANSKLRPKDNFRGAEFACKEEGTLPLKEEALAPPPNCLPGGQAPGG